MRRVNVDGQGDEVKRFVLQLLTDPGSAILELEGRAVVYMVPVETTNSEEEEPWTEARNQRRCELIEKEIVGTIDLNEAIELGKLELEVRRELRRTTPLPLEDARNLRRELLEKVQSGGG